MGSRKQKRYDMHSPQCPDLCSLGLTKAELLENFGIEDENIIKAIDILKNNQCLDYYDNTIQRTDRKA